LLQGISEFPTAEALAEEIRQVGFAGVSFERLSLGIGAIHVGHKTTESAAWAI
jgi:demethylmenaquinone methyltransferase / 2-methoxy-6-polyprenyl-1,4-benzoquinol methylase